MLKKNDPQINNRRDLFDYYEEHMNKTYRQILNSGHLEGDTNVLKTYLLTLSAILLPQEALGRNLRVWLLFRANCEAAQRLLHAPRSADLGNTPGARVISFE